MEVTLEGVPVIFPFQPYGIQLSYMRSVIKALQNKQNALLESPTGTGKTLSLLCSTLAWLDTKKYADLNASIIAPDDKNVSFVPEDIKSSFVDGEGEKKANNKGKNKGWKNGQVPIKIIYSSRTHSQLNQACKELKNSHYSYCSSVTIGSRDQMCINPSVKRLDTATAKNQACRQKIKSKECTFHTTFQQKVQDLNMDGQFVYDIEDMVEFGNKNKCCPYYTAKAKSDFNTSLVFMPYNYVIDPKIRQTLKMEFQNAVIIFDEGHNIEQVCEDAMSTELKAEWLAVAISVFDNALSAKKLIEDGKYDGTNEASLEEIDIHELARVKMFVCDLEHECDTLVRNTTNGKGHHEPETLFKIFQNIGIDMKTAALLNSVSEKLIAFIMDSATSYMVNASVSALTSVSSFVEMLLPFSQEGVNMSDYKKDLNKNYKVFVELQTSNSMAKTWKKKSEKNWTISLWCLSPSVAIKSLLNLGVYSILITSGTLSPLESFESEMGVPFPIKLQNPHVIKRTQLSIQMLFKDPNGMDLAASFDRRNDNKYYQGLGISLIELARVIPKGIFIFFSSYSAITKSIEIWQSGSTFNIWNSITSLKQVFIEPKNKTEFSNVIEDFRNACDTTRSGAIFMAVSRGKLSEGIDLRDDYCRAVIIIGLPYPARYDPRVELKQTYLNDRKSDFPGAISGIQWYMLQMKRALNQAVGRVVRHRQDYGSIIICDSRFRKINDGLSRWIRPFIAADSFAKDFSNNIRDIQSFFKISTQTPNKEALKDENAVVKNSSFLSRTKTKSLGPSTSKSSISKANDEAYQNAFAEMKESFVKLPSSNSEKKLAQQTIMEAFKSNLSHKSDSIFSALESFPNGNNSANNNKRKDSNCFVKSTQAMSKKQKINVEYLSDENYSKLMEDSNDSDLLEIIP